MLEWTDANLEDGLTVRLIASDIGLRGIEFRISEILSARPNPDNPVLLETIKQLAAYLAGSLREFHVPLDMQGTDFQKRVWRELETIPFGQTRSYSQIAEALGSPRAVRAVGAANGANPIPIIVPCHRVIGSSGRLVGYGGGLPLKKRLLTLEGVSTQSLPL